MALPKIGFNEGSLLRRTLLHVGTFVLGSAAFIGLTSFVLVSIAKGVIAPAAPSPSDEPAALALSARVPGAPLPRPHHTPGRRMSGPNGPVAAPTKDD